MPEKAIDGLTLSASLRLDLLEERAAILQFNAGMSRKEAEAKAALMYGFKTWMEALEG